MSEMRHSIVAPRAPFAMAMLSMLLLVGLFGGMVDTFGPAALIVVAFFGACAIALVVPLVRRDRLVLAHDRFEFGLAGRRQAIAWTDVDGFAVVRYGFRYAAGIRFVPGRDGLRARLPSIAGAYPSVLPGWYGLRADDLVDILEERRRLALAAG